MTDVLVHITNVRSIFLALNFIEVEHLNYCGLPLNETPKKYVTELLKYEEHQLLLSLERKERNQWHSNGIFHPILYKKCCKLA